MYGLEIISGAPQACFAIYKEILMKVVIKQKLKNAYLRIINQNFKKIKKVPLWRLKLSIEWCNFYYCR